VDKLYSGAINACSYAQKLNGKDRYFFSSQNLNEMAVNHLQIENSLHEAIQNDELQLHYQPKIDVATGRIAGFEALLRWNSARLGFVPPDKFIPVAEQSGQMDAIGDWVLFTACQHLRAWMDMELEVGSIAVNISGVQLRQQNLPNRIQNILDKFNIKTHQLEIELTESSLVKTYDQSFAILKQIEETHQLEIELTESSLVKTYDQSFAILKQIEEMGLRVTMDDFGTGYSSLSYLKNIPLSCLKIDKSFISDINQDENADKLIASIVSIAHGLGLEVVAEGVEEEYQVDHLIALNCEYLQGYYFSRPVPQSEVADLLQKQPMAAA
jgi:EAL domain-containing protein (putative c-di-GMP-specific phosphodiesterase class I)